MYNFLLIALLVLTFAFILNNKKCQFRCYFPECNEPLKYHHIPFENFKPDDYKPITPEKTLEKILRN